MSQLPLAPKMLDAACARRTSGQWPAALLAQAALIRVREDTIAQWLTHYHHVNWEALILTIPPPKSYKELMKYLLLI